MRCSVFSAVGVLLTTALSVIGLAGCKLGSHRVDGSSQTHTVGIPLTKVKNQGMTGFCWSYGINGMVESWALARKSLKLTLSEEYTAFYRMAKQLHAFTVESDGDALAAGYYSCPIKQGAKLQEALELLRDFGVVPESVWSAKSLFSHPDSVDNLKMKLLERLGQFVKGRKAGATTLQEIVDNVMVGDGRFPPLPANSFSYGGKSWTPQSFLRERLGFDANNYVELTLTKPEDFSRLVAASKRALAEGMTIPLGFHLLHGRSAEIKPFEANHVEPKVNSLRSEGGHIVLMSDFVNQGGQLGAMSKAEIEKAVAASPEDLAFLVVKNSWGEDKGSFTPGIPRGFMVVDKGYLKATLAYGYAAVLVSRAIAANPESAPYTVASYAAAGSNDYLNSLYSKEIDSARKMGLMSGMPDGSFRPLAPVSRAQLVMVVTAGLRGIPGSTVKFASPVSSAFRDVPASHPAAAAIAWASAAGLVSGVSEMEFSPEKPATRAALVSVLNKSAELAWRWSHGSAALAVSGPTPAFRDNEGHWAASAIDRMSAFCNVAFSYKGESGIFAPDQGATRDELAAAIVRWSECLKKK